jgi:hypothetical protein
MDDIDTAQELQELVLRRTLETQRQRTEIPFSGVCLSCEEPITKGRYCDSTCREDHESRRKRK